MKSRVVLWASVAIAIVLAVFLVIWLTRPAGAPVVPSPAPTDTPRSTSQPSPVPTPAATVAPEAIGDDATALVLPFMSAETALRGNPATPLAMEEVATGSALEDLEVNARELLESGLVQVGSPAVVNATVTAFDDSATTPMATVSACLDYSTVDVQIADGTSVKDENAAQRVPTIFSIVKVEDRWLVSERTFPDEPTC